MCRRTWRPLTIVGVLGTLLAGPATPMRAQSSTTSQKPATTTLPPANATFAEFHNNLQRYLTLRKTVEAGLPKLSDTKDPKKIADHESQLAIGIRAARKDVKAGDIFTPKVAAEFRRILAADAASRTPAERANIMTEVPNKAPVVNALYPTDSASGPAALASFPSKLLAVLPELPDGIEYRFLGQSLVLRDGSANLIIDYLSSVAPARGGGQ